MNQATDIVLTCFIKNVLMMGPNGVVTNVQLLSDVFVCIALDNELQYLDLSSAQDLVDSGIHTCSVHNVWLFMQNKANKRPINRIEIPEFENRVFLPGKALVTLFR